MLDDLLAEIWSRPAGPPCRPIHLAWFITEELPPRVVVVEHHYNQQPERLEAWLLQTRTVADADRALEDGGWERLTDWLWLGRDDAVAFARDNTGRWTR